jgi:S-(hydroxymethyl)glutathione dehydrogenase/alcohol dehydrogenase
MKTMRQALECCHRAGASASSASPAPARDLDPAIPAGHRPGVEGTAFARARPHRRAADRRRMEGKINIDDLITHRLALDDTIGAST